MADRYWVGDGRGGGTWTTTDTSVWSTAAPLEFTASLSGTTLTTPTSPPLAIGMRVYSNGGISLGTISAGSGTTWTVTLTNTYASQTMYAFASGASVPTSADNVFFPKPVGRAISMTMTGALNCGNLSVLLSGITLGGSGSLTVTGGMTVTGATLSFSGGLIFAGTGAQTIEVSSGLNSSITFNNAAGTWTLGAALSTNSSLNVTAGSFITNNYALGATALNSTGTLTRSISLGSSAVALTGTSPINLASTGLTFNAGTSTITMNGPTISVATGNQTFYNASISNTTASSITIGGVNTWNNLSITNYYTAGVRTISFSDNQTINGTLTLVAPAGATTRTLVFSNIFGTARTLTVGSFAAGSADYDFRDIVIAGGAAPISGTRFGDCGGNSGITFSTPKTVYRVSTSTAWNSTTGWATTPGGVGALANFPLAQDTAVIGATAPAASGTLNMSIAYPVGTLDMSARTSGSTLTFTTASNLFYGNWIGGAGATISGSLTFAGRNTQTITSAGRTFPSTVQFDGVGGTFVLGDAFTCASTTYLQTGTLNLNGYTATTFNFSSSAGASRNIDFNGGNITVTGYGSGAFFVGGTPPTLSGTPTVNFTYISNLATTISPGSGTDSNAFNFNILAGTYRLTLGGTLGNVNFTGFSGTLGASTRTFTGGLILSPTMALDTGPTSTQTFAGASGTGQITCNGKAIPCPITFASTGKTWALQDALTTSYGTSLNSGTLDLNGKTLTCPSFTSSGTIARNLTFNGGTLAINGTGLCATFNGSGFTSTAGSAPGQLSFTGGSAKSMLGGGLSFACALNQGNGGTLTLNNGNYTFDNITASYRPATISLPANYTTTVNNFTLNGIAGSLVTLNSTIAGSRASLSKSSGAVAVNYLSIKDISATGGATWTNNLGTNGGNNLGWTFTAIAIAALNGNFFSFF